MRYLCLIYLDEKQLAAMPQAEMDDLNARHLALNEDLLQSGHFVEAEALTPGASATCVRRMSSSEAASRARASASA